MKKPNFFLIGAPKCGTTSLATWLFEREDVFVSAQKEPHYFNTDGGHYRTFNLQQYELLFKDSNKKHIAIGEGSTGYLSSEEAVPHILKYSPDAKFIACVRNPLEMAPSLHGQNYFTGIEDYSDFNDAWSAQDERANKKWVSRNGTDYKFFQYGAICLLGKQVERLFNIAGRDRCLIIVMDDLKKNPQQEFKRVLEFLGADTSGIGGLPVMNVAKRRKYRFLRSFTLSIGLIKRKLGVRKSIGLLRKVESWNAKSQARVPLNPDMKVKLKKYFSNDVELLGKLLDRDLSHWMK